MVRTVDFGGVSEARRRRRFRLLVSVAMAIFLVGIPLLRGLTGFYVDYLWFKEVEFEGVWGGLLAAKFIPAALFSIIFFVLAVVNFTIAQRVAPRVRPQGPEDEIVEQYRRVVGGHQRFVNLVVSGVLALIAGSGASVQWKNWLLFRNRVDFGIEDPQFHWDIGFYVFQLPFLKFVVEWTIAAVAILTIATAITHYLNGGIRIQGAIQGALDRVTPQVKAHLSVLLALMALLKAADYYLQRFELNFSTRGVVHGASATDVGAQLPALHLLTLISIFGAVLFLVNIRRRGWVLPAAALGLWVFVSIVIGTIVPALYQRFGVEPNEAQREKKYIQRNVDATRAAFGIDKVKIKPIDYTENLGPEDIRANADAINRARLWDPEPLLSAYRELQEIRPFYIFNDVDVDRYKIDGRLTQVAISAREINVDRLPNKSWLNRHLFYTHGQGVVVSPTDQASDRGTPLFFLEDIPSRGTDLELNQPDIYYGEKLEGYSFVKARQREFDFPSGSAERTSRYEGSGGVPMSSFLRRGIFSAYFGDFNPMVSKQITASTRVMFHRNVADRVRKAAPFLRFDADPYPVVLDGKVVWVIDGYTTTDRYPYSEAITPGDRLNQTSGLRSNLNYVRNSVKAVVDAYDGSITFYAIDDVDPIIRAYRKAFPKMFTDGSKMPKELQEHLRYPEDIFRVQSDVYSTYHVTSASERFSRSDQWAVSPDPSTGRLEFTLGNGNATTVTGRTTATGGSARATAAKTSRRMDPYYLLMRLPGETKERFVLVQPFVPVSGDDKLTNLLSFVVAKSDPGEYGELVAYVMPRNRQISGPVQVDTQINTTPEISSQFTPLNQSGSQVSQGTLQLIPVGNSILYVRPIHIRGKDGKLPEVRFVVVFYAGRAAMAESLDGALAKLFQGLPNSPSPAPRPTMPPSDGSPAPAPAPTPDTAATVDQLLAEASRAYEDAQEALRNGDLAGYQAAVNRVGELLRQIETLTAG